MTKAQTSKPEQTAEELAAERHAWMVRRFTGEVESANEKLKAFAEKMTGSDPLYALKWADGEVFLPAARREIYTWALTAIDDGKTLEEVKTYFEAQLLRMTRSLVSSTSTSRSSNMVDDCKVQAIAELIDKLDW